MRRKLISIPVFHTEPEMGRAEELFKEAGISAWGEEGWLRHRREVDTYWNTVVEKLWEKLAGHRIKDVRLYQDTHVVGGDRGVEMVKKIAERGSRNHQLLLELVEGGATLMRTEKLELVREEYNLVENMIDAQNASAAEEAANRYRGRKDTLLKKRDEYIAGRIDKTLEKIGVLFLGHFHDVEKELPADIELVRIEKVEGLASEIGKWLRGLRS